MGCETVGHLQQRLTVVILSIMSLAASGSGRQRVRFKNYIINPFLIKFGAGKDDKF